MDDNVFLPNIHEWHTNFDSFETYIKIEFTVEKPCSEGLIVCEYIKASPCMPYFGKWIDVGETAIPHFNVARKGYLAREAEDIFSTYLIANSSRQGRVGTGSQHADKINMTRTSSDDNCESSQKRFVLFSTDNNCQETTKCCESTAAKANADGFPEGGKEESSTTQAKLGEIFSSKIWNENAVDETDKNENKDPIISATVGGSCNYTQERKNGYRTFRQQLAPAIFKMVENKSFGAEKAVADESVVYDVYDHSTAEEILISDVFVNHHDRSVVGLHSMVFDLVQMKFEKDRLQENSSLNSEPQLLHLNEKKLKASFSYAKSDRTL